jgi:LysR family hca operon transcriptional activator
MLRHGLSDRTRTDLDAEALRILRDELPNIDVMISSQYSPLLAEGLSKGKIDAAFLRKERALPDLAFSLLVKEPLIVILRSDHRLAALKAISPRDLGMSTGGLGLLPAYAQNFLPASVTSRPLRGNAPTVDLVLGYRKSNQSPILKLLLSRLDELVARVSKKAD